MRIMFSASSTARWVILYAICGAVPGSLLLIAPPEKLNQALELNRETMTVRQVVSWFPTVMLGAAGVTLVVALIFGALHTIAAAIQGGFIQGSEMTRCPSWLTRIVANGVERLYSTFRLLSALLGAGVVLLGVGLIWRNIADGTLTADIDEILLLIASGTGLATGAAFYKS